MTEFTLLGLIAAAALAVAGAFCFIWNIRRELK
jgi:hypothetical protein